MVETPAQLVVGAEERKNTWNFMAKKFKRVWLAVDEATHEKVIEMADRHDRTVQGQYRQVIVLGVSAWEQKITGELQQQQAFVSESFQSKREQKALLKSDEMTERRRRA